MDVYLRCSLGMAKIRTDAILNRLVEKASGVTDCELTQEPLTLDWKIGILPYVKSKTCLETS